MMVLNDKPSKGTKKATTVPDCSNDIEDGVREEDKKAFRILLGHREKVHYIDVIAIFRISMFR